MSKIYLTSDSHFQHVNICGPSISRWSEGYRDFQSLEDMENAIIDSINSVVQPGDSLYHLGDVFMGEVLKHAARIRARINCREIHLVTGNHDKVLKKDQILRNQLFASSCEFKEERYKGILVTYCHYPLATWNEAGKGSLLAYAHCHGTYNHPGRGVDVGWDVFRKPILLDEFVDLAMAKPISIIDHHGSNTSYH